MCDTFKPLFPTKAALGLDDPKYPASWQGEHFPGLSSGKMHLNGVTVAPVHAAAFPKEVHPVGIIKADNADSRMPAPGTTVGGNGNGSHPMKMSTANVWGPQ
jgi:hypothetical protein